MRVTQKATGAAEGRGGKVFFSCDSPEMQPNFCAEVYLWRHYRQDLPPPIYSSSGSFFRLLFAGAAAGSGM